MRTNGTYCALLAEASEPAFDDYGNPIAAAESWSEPKPCLIQPNANATIVTYADGQWVKASYIVLAEQPQDVALSRIRLQQNGQQLGEYQVSVPQSVDTMGRIKIVV